jgi:hypothetical protein
MADEINTGVTQQDAAADTLADEGIEVIDDNAEPKPNDAASVKPTVEAAPTTKEDKPAKTFTQSEVEAIVKERLKKSSKAVAIAEKLRAVGYDEDAVLAQLEAEVNKKLATLLGADPNALREFVKEQISQHPTVLQASEVVRSQQIQAQINDLIKKYPDATQDEIKQAFDHQQANNLPTLKAAYLDKFSDVIEEKIRQRALDAHQQQAKRGVEASDDPAGKTEKPKLTASKDEMEWAQRRVKQGHYKSVREAIESLQKTKGRK